MAVVVVDRVDAMDLVAVAKDVLVSEGAVAADVVAVVDVGVGVGDVAVVDVAAVDVAAVAVVGARVAVAVAADVEDMGRAADVGLLTSPTPWQ